MDRYLNPEKQRQLNRWAEKEVPRILEEYRENITQKGGVYIALVNNGRSFDLEIEVDEENIGGTFFGAARQADGAVVALHIVEHYFKERGIRVYRHRENWNNAGIK